MSDKTFHSFLHPNSTLYRILLQTAECVWIQSSFSYSEMIHCIRRKLCFIFIIVPIVTKLTWLFYRIDRKSCTNILFNHYCLLWFVFFVCVNSTVPTTVCIHMILTNNITHSQSACLFGLWSYALQCIWCVQY